MTILETTKNMSIPQPVATAIDEIISDMKNAGETPRPYRVLEEIVSMADNSVREWVAEHDARVLDLIQAVASACRATTVLDYEVHEYWRDGDGE